MRRNFDVCALFLRIHPKLKRFLSPILGEEQNKKKEESIHSETERYLRPKSLLSVLLLQFYDQQQYVCETTCLCAANLRVCAVSETFVRAHTRSA